MFYIVVSFGVEFQGRFLYPSYFPVNSSIETEENRELQAGIPIFRGLLFAAGKILYSELAGIKIFVLCIGWFVKC